MTGKTGKKKVKTAAGKSVQTSRYGVDIAQEFHEVKSSIYNLSEKINDWKGVFERELTKLNMNMERALNQIADHEERITTLEKQHTVDETQQGVWNVVRSYALKGGSFILGAIIIVMAAYGVRPAVKLFNLFAS